LTNNKSIKPLADRIRPETLSSFFGQEHLVGNDKPICKMIETDSVYSFILWGPPGTGKTTLAKIIANQTKADFYSLNAVSSGVKDVRKIIDIGKNNLEYNRKTILFIDEIHRFNKSQQDALLSSVESGEIILIGATTENPSFEVIPALRSRVRIYILNELTETDLINILNLALTKDEILSKIDIEVEDVKFLLFLSGGDARTMLNLLEAAVDQSPKENDKLLLTNRMFENIIQRKTAFYDKSGEEHYNIISAFIKSVRGSDPDAALYWMARMLDGGEDPLFIARRLIILASEDIGNASPNGLVLAEAAFGAVEKIGMPEARIILSQCVTYLCGVPKSNAAYMGIKNAEEFISKNKNYPVPFHLRNAPTKLMKNLGYSKDYKYPHSFDGNFVQENYFPEEMKQQQFYSPSSNGHEKNILERLMNIWKGIKKY